jgi:ADP-ribose pyrophosphatase
MTNTVWKAKGSALGLRSSRRRISARSMALVGGYLDPGEAPLAAAQRELREETGYTAPDWRSLGSYAVDGNRGVGHAHLFLAQNAHRMGDIDTDDLESQALLRLDRAQVTAALAQGEFKVLPWAAALALALVQLD